MKPRLILMCGLPGSGKTTLARRLAGEVPAIRLCTDECLWLRSERDEKRREARELGVDIELHYFDVLVDELASRLEQRNAEGNPSVFSITREQVEEYFETFEAPDESELALFPVSIVHRSGSRRKG